MALSLAQQYLTEHYQQVIGDSNYQAIAEKLKLKMFSPKDLGITYRELNHWSSKNLLFESTPGKMRRFNLIELVWIEILKVLRQYNLSLEIIKALKENLLITFTFGELFEVDEETIVEVAKLNLQKQMSAHEYDEFVLSGEFDKMLLSDEFRSDIDGISLNIFELILFEVYILKLNHKLLINSYGFWSVDNELFNDELAKSAYHLEHFEKSYISISIGSLLSGIFEDYSVEDLKGTWRLINDSEVKILDAIKWKTNVKSVTIRFNEHSQVDLFEVTEVLKVSPQQYLKNLMVTGGYQQISVVTQKGDIVHCERTTKQKI